MTDSLLDDNQRQIRDSVLKLCAGSGDAYLIQGREKACFAVTEPDAGLNTTQIKTLAKRQGDRYVVSGSKIWTSTAQA